jgi:thioredoxin-related protein
MPEIIVRLEVLILLSLLLFLLVRSGQQFVELQRRRALTAPPLDSSMSMMESSPIYREGHSAFQNHAPTDQNPDVHSVRILAFSSPDCKQCHQLQTPALRRVQEIHGANVTIVEIDAPGRPDLVHQYHVLTVPTTVILDPSGHALAVNYGFANTQRLLEQVDTALSSIV